MASDWEQVSLGSLVDIKHGFAFKSEFFSETPTNHQLVTPGNFAIGGGFQFGKGKYYSGPVPQEYILKEGQVVVTMTDLSKAADTLGYAAVIPKTEEIIWLHNQRVGLVIFKNEESLSPVFAHYLMRSPEYRHHVVAGATGSTVKHTAPTRICEYKFKLPSIAEQRNIGHTLSLLDDRITLLRETNKTLEAIAQAIFKSWFIDFDPVRAKMEGRAPAGMDEETLSLFPDELVESELGLVPKGWCYSTVGESFVLTMGQSPPGDTYNEVGNGMPFYQGRTDFGFRFPTQRIFCSAPTRIAELNDTLVSVRAPVGDVNMAIERCCLGRGVASVRHPMNYRGFTFYSMRNLGAKFKAFDGEGTVFGSINKKDFASLSVISPSGNVLAKYDDLTESIDEKIALNELMIRTLTELRDGLLPRLISGKLRISDEELESQT